MQKNANESDRGPKKFVHFLPDPKPPRKKDTPFILQVRTAADHEAARRKVC